MTFLKSRHRRNTSWALCGAHCRPAACSWKIHPCAQMIVTGGSLKTRLAGRSKAMKTCRRDILAIAPLNVDVLLRGETGTGKGLAAHCIHDMSPRKSKAFVTLNCATVSLEYIEESLFSDQDKISEATGGTLFLDDLGALEEAVQARIFRFFEDHGNEPNSPRIVAALKEEPDVLIAAGKLRADLYYLINVAQVLLPPLRERNKDIFVLLEHFIREAAGRHNLKLPDISAEDLAPFRTYDWPGNVRELRNAAEKLVIGLDVVLGTTSSSTKITAGGYNAALQKFEFDLLQTALMQAGGCKGDAAEILGIPRKRLYLRLKQYGLN
jgi:two-component system, NtrC family, phosphoglycerate transport system response regulator PgtA